MGRLEIKDFEVRNEAALAELDKRGRPTKSGPRKDGLKFQRFWLPFKTDDKFIRLGDSMLRGPDGNQTKELERLIDFLVTEEKPDLLVLSSVLLAGMEFLEKPFTVDILARKIRKVLDADA